MALQLPLIDSAVGYNFPESYARVMSIRGFKEDSLIAVNFYADAQARLDGKQPVKQMEFPAVTDDINGKLYPELYRIIKAFPEFAGAVDV